MESVWRRGQENRRLGLGPRAAVPFCLPNASHQFFPHGHSSRSIPNHYCVQEKPVPSCGVCNYLCHSFQPRIIGQDSRHRSASLPGFLPLRGGPALRYLPSAIHPPAPNFSRRATDGRDSSMTHLLSAFVSPFLLFPSPRVELTTALPETRSPCLSLCLSASWCLPMALQGRSAQERQVQGPSQYANPTVKFQSLPLVKDATPHPTPNKKAIPKAAVA
ncbi:hypothetical protein QBC35DRAFT_33785 [Podospora australis]|uniref:Uncharacterized protein n=1 Tax=Podospora australis TaxID=1536484 RepID=A0AAN7AMM0_9PEZI|nr:hypothetical protein QBC35DRAFT_33785 [Podospora australis]